MADRKKIYDQIAELMNGDTFGYGKELKSGDEAFERLLDEGTIAGKDGKRIPGKKDRDGKKRGEMLGKLLEKGEALYIYKKGEEYPREVRYNQETGKIEVSKKPINQMRPDELLEKPPKPGLLARYFDLIAKMFGGRVGSCRKWDRYNEQQEALKNVKDEKRVNRRKRFDPILNGTEKGSQENEKEVGKESKTSELSPKEKQQNALELQLLRNLEKEKQLQEQLRQLREENAQIEKSLAGKGSVKNEKTQPTLTGNEQQIKADRKLAKELQKEENKKYVEEQQQIKSDEEFAKSLQEEEMKQQEPQPEVDDLLDKLKGGDKEKKLPENVENNLRKLYSDAQKGRQVLTDALNDPKNEKLAGGNTVANIVAYENIKNSINLMGDDQELIDNINSKDFVRNWKGAARLSPNVVYASDYLHDKQFFEQNVLSEKGVQKMSDSMDRGVSKVLLQQGLAKDGLGKERDIFWGPSNEAEKMAMRDEEREKMGPPQEDEIKVGKQPRKPVVKQNNKVSEPKPVPVTHHPLEQNQPTNPPQPAGPAIM